MQLSPDWLQQQGEDAPLLHVVDTAFFPKPPERIGVAVSGGGDSMALLHVAWRWSVQTGHPIEAVTVDHGLRPGAAAEAAHVAGFCADHDIPHTILTWDGAGGEGNLQAMARAARYRLIANWARLRGIGGVMLGHTADDVAETFLMRLARKSGLDGLAAMAPRFEREGLHWVRPFWQQGRAELRNYLRRHGVTWCEDPSNDDTGFERVRARKVLKALAPLGIDAQTIKESAFHLNMAKHTLAHFTRQAVATHVTEDRGDLIIRPMVDADMLPPETQRQILNRATQWFSGAQYPPRDSAMIEADIGLSRVGKHVLAGCVLTSEKRAIRVTREHNAVKDTRCATTEIWDGRWQLDGPHEDGLEIRALGAAVKDCPDWRDSGLPRVSLLSSPAIWRGEILIAAPLAGYNADWDARIVTDFASFMLSH